MKIISNFSDYYDSIIAYGVDPLITYKRFTEEHNLDTKYLGTNPTKFDWRHSHLIELKADFDFSKIGIETFYIFFCNEIYLGWKIWKKSRHSQICDLYDFFYTKESILKYLADVDTARNYYGFRHPSWKAPDSLKDISEMFDKRTKLLTLYKPEENFYIKYSSPVIVFTNTEKGVRLITNPKLKDFKFQKIKEPFTAFQEISTFISNTFGYPGNPTVEVSEKTKIEKHGFNKWSFRKMKEDK